MPTTFAPPAEPIGQVLTPDEYDALPENPRRELVDGVVHMMATPTPWHQGAAHALRNALRRLRPAELRVNGEVEIRLGDELRRNPDVLVVRAAGFDLRKPRVHPAQVVLAVEVVSHGSETTDRDVKPREYAAAGIEHYWRVEIDQEVEVNTFRLGDRATYVQTGVFRGDDIVTAPGLAWARFTVSELNDEG